MNGDGYADVVAGASNSSRPRASTNRVAFISGMAPRPAW
ncbi:MAG: FG-GAP repeat protein [Flavobacteriales bacterium]|nr:FG-GAP repeat protein [Flavobacteriales bacterium]